MKCKLLQEGERCLKELHAEPQKLRCYCWQSAIILFSGQLWDPAACFSLLQPQRCLVQAGNSPVPSEEAAPGRVVPGHLWGLHLLPSVTPQPLTRQHSLLQAASPSTDSKLWGKKYNTRDDSGWQINKLALITLRVSNLYFSHARQWWLLSRFGPTVLIPMPPDPRDPLAAWQGPAGGHRAQRPAPNLPAWTEGLCEAAGLVRPKNAFTGTPAVCRLQCQSFAEAPVPGLGKQQPLGLADVRFLPGE